MSSECVSKLNVYFRRAVGIQSATESSAINPSYESAKMGSESNQGDSQ